MDKLFVNAVAAIYDAAPDPSRWPQALQAIADCFGDVGAVIVYGRDDGSFGAFASPRESAEKLGIAEETARTALKRVFSKTGVSRQSELVALLTKLALR